MQCVFLLVVSTFAISPADLWDHASRHMADGKAYQGCEIRSQGRSCKFEDLSDFEKHIFYLANAEVISRKLEDLDYHWNPKSNPNSLRLIKQARQAHAMRRELLLREVFSKYPKEFTEKEREHYPKILRALHVEKGLLSGK